MKHRLDYQKAILRFIEDLAEPTKPQSESHAAWADWLNLEPLSSLQSRLLKLLDQEVVRLEFRLRALILLTAVDLAELPKELLPSETKGTPRNFLTSSLMETLRKNLTLTPYLGELICLHRQIENYQIWSSERGLEALATYNHYIIELLALLPENDELAEKLFSLFLLNDPVCHYNLNARSGYNPLNRLWQNPKVPEKWKVVADQKMREIVIAELTGKAQPREIFEYAPIIYQSLVSDLADPEWTTGYSSALLASQIEFILNLPNTIIFRKEFSAHELKSIYQQLLPYPEYSDLRYRLVRYTVLTNGTDFQIETAEEVLAFEKVSREFPQDTNLKDALQEIIAQAKERLTNDNRIIQAQADKRVQVMAKMM